MPLIPLLRDEAKRRGLLADGEALDLATVYRLVRDMPYGSAVDEAPEAVLSAWRGSSAGKHDLLAELLDELGLVTMTVMATHEFEPDYTDWLPPHLLTEVTMAPVPDVHTFLRVEHDPVMHEWMTVDATWPAATRRLGLPANAGFEPGRDRSSPATRSSSCTSRTTRNRQSCGNESLRTTSAAMPRAARHSSMRSRTGSQASSGRRHAVWRARPETLWSGSICRQRSAHRA